MKSVNPGASITLTGHSLGGGLASLVGVFFGVQAQTFDQAPFALTALFGASELLAYLSGKHLYSADDLLPLSSYIAQRDISGDLIPNAGLVKNINVQGEFLSSGFRTIFDRLGTLAETLGATSPGVSVFDMHSQALLAAFLQSRITASSGKALNDVTAKLPDLLGMIFDKKLFAYETDDADNRNFLDNMVRHEAGMGESLPMDQMVSRFTADMWEIARAGGLTLTDANISKTLTAFAMQKYYEETSTSAAYKTQLFTEVTGGIRFDMADVSKTFGTALQNGEKLKLSDAKGFELYFQDYLAQSRFSAGERQLRVSLLPYMRDGYLQAGADDLAYTDILNRGAFMLSGGANQCLFTRDFTRKMAVFPCIHSIVSYNYRSKWIVQRDRAPRVRRVRERVVAGPTHNAKHGNSFKGATA